MISDGVCLSAKLHRRLLPRIQAMVVVKYALLLLCGVLSLLVSMVAAANSIRYVRLSNGLQVLVKPVHTAPVVLSSLWYKVGGSYEHDGITGVSHLLEHMMFQGTARHPGQSLNQLIAAEGGIHNAFTAYDNTVYYAQVAIQKLDQVLRLEADRMQYLSLTPDAFAREKQVVLEERNLRVVNDPQALTLERFHAAAFVNSPYHHPVVGWGTDIDAMTLQDVRSWYKKWYAPNNAVLIIVGDVNPAHVISTVRRIFASVKAHHVPVVKPRLEVRALGQRTLEVHWPAALPWYIEGYPVPSLKTLAANRKWQAYALLLLASALNTGDSSRLQQQLINTNKALAADVSVNYNPYSLYQGQFSVAITPLAQQNLVAVRKLLHHQIKDIQTHLLSTTELAKVKAQVIAARVYQQDSLLQQAMSLGRLSVIGLPWQMAADFSTQIQALSAQQLREVARLYLQPSKRTAATLYPKLAA